MKKYIEAYKKLYSSVYGKDHLPYKEEREKLSNFVAMRGKNYDKKGKQDIRFLTVGRATNGWGRGLPTDNAESFAVEAYRTFTAQNRFESDWHMQENGCNPFSSYIKLDGVKPENGKYFLSKSPFINTSLNIYGGLCYKNAEKSLLLYNEIAWSNIYKVAPTVGGNPSTKLIYAQAQACVSILKEEIRLLEPTHILLEVDKSWISWSTRGEIKFDFMDAFGDYECYCKKLPCDVKKGIVQCAFKSGISKVLVTARPETIDKSEYVKNVIKAFNAIG